MERVGEGGERKSAKEDVGFCLLEVEGTCDTHVTTTVFKMIATKNGVLLVCLCIFCCWLFSIQATCLAYPKDGFYQTIYVQPH